jgi:hypothetical protein
VAFGTIPRLQRTPPQAVQQTNNCRQLGQVNILGPGTCASCRGTTSSGIWSLWSSDTTRNHARSACCACTAQSPPVLLRVPTGEWYLQNTDKLGKSDMTRPWHHHPPPLSASACILLRIVHLCNGQEKSPHCPARRTQMLRCCSSSYEFHHQRSYEFQQRSRMPDVVPLFSILLVTRRVHSFPAQLS